MHMFIQSEVSVKDRKHFTPALRAQFQAVCQLLQSEESHRAVEDGSEAEDGGGLGDVRISLFGLVQHVLQGEHREDPFRMAAGLFT